MSQDQATINALWVTLREAAPDLFDTGQEHGPWLYGDTRIDHGPYPWMKDAWSYHLGTTLRAIEHRLERSLLGYD